ncbi:MAG: PKD domain-containing protein [Bacteroidales bacterium]|nr:PKD domain-containing protein [Bacteroidales bacterium]
MKKLFTLMIVLAALSLSLTQSLQAQRSVPGVPQSSLYENLSEKIDYRELEAPDMTVIRAEDLAKPLPYRAGVSVPVNLSIDNSGEWTDLPDGGRIWRLSLEVEGALALGVYYDNFWLPFGGELYLYNEEKTNIIGAYTEENNNPDCVFSNQLVEGDVVILEYYQPAGQSIEPLISISEVSYTYRGVYFESSPERGGAAWCMININCSPEGDNWQDEKRGVVKQFMKIGYAYYLCSGSLINNTEQDMTPYLLTAFHCGEGASIADLNVWVFYFNYESSTCAGNWGPSNYTMTGCTKRAEGGYTTGSDFLLLELKTNVPASYSAYFNGWDRTNIGADSGVNIHHPMGDIKKISTYNYQLTSSQWNNNGVLSHWKTYWAETPHGTSITEGGSSGSPLFSQDGLVVGDLTGGPADDCNNPSYSLYGKVYWSWDKMGPASSQRLKPWLDPGDYGPERWEGTYTGTAPDPDFAADQTSLQTGESVIFEDLTTGNPLEWDWTFEGGTPASYTGQVPPEIIYNTAGRYDVTLEVSNTIGTASKDSIEMIIVGSPLANFSASNTYLTSGETTDFTDETSGDPTEWTWTFSGGTPETSNEQNPGGIQYDTQGAYDVKLVALNEYGADSITKEDFVVVDGPFADFEADATNILAGESVIFTDMSINNPTSWSWKFFGGSPGSYNGQDPSAITYNSTGDYDVKLTVSNDLGTQFIIKGNYIHVGGVGIDESSLDEMLTVYPNPARGSFVLDPGQNDLKGSQVNVMNAKGEIVYQQYISEETEKITIDLSDYPAGIYMLRLQVGDIQVDRKITLIK